MLLKDKVAIITGAASARGLGFATAKLFAENGASVVIIDLNGEASKAAAAALGEGHLGLAANVADEVQVQAAVEQILAKYGRVDVLVNNAGIMPMAPMSALKVDEWDKMIDVNVKGVLYGIASVLPTMKAQKSGHIINLSSVAGLKVSGGVGTVYSATKFAVKAISEGLRMEVAGDNIRVTTLYPGAVASEMKFGSSDSASSQAMQAFYEANEIPADSVARAVAYAVEQPDDVAVNEITIRPTRQEF